MENLVIAVNGNDDTIINMINYVFWKGVTASSYTDFIIRKQSLPPYYNNRVLNVDDVKDDIFSNIFSIDKKLINDDNWYDFQNHKCIKNKEINIVNPRIYKEEIFNITDISKKIGFSIDYPVIKVKELQRIFEDTIYKLFGDIYNFKILKMANDISLSNEICIIKGFTKIEEFITFKRTFGELGNVINITSDDIPCDYKVNINNTEMQIFYNIQQIVKFILL